jgi:8-oxo-dGTP pyrophosphatase MutT (NUDIX family)
MVNNLSQKTRNLVGVVIWVIDPEHNTRVFLRHNKPFFGYPNEWNFVYGHVEPGEDHLLAAKREVEEETTLKVDMSKVIDLNYRIERLKNKIITKITFVSLKVEDISCSIRLNEESIGYDWKLINEAKNTLKHLEQIRALDLLPVIG